MSQKSSYRLLHSVVWFWQEDLLLKKLWENFQIMYLKKWEAISTKLNQQLLRRFITHLIIKLQLFSFSQQELILLLLWLNLLMKKESNFLLSVWVKVKDKKQKGQLRNQNIKVVGFYWQTVTWPNRGCQA